MPDPKPGLTVVQWQRILRAAEEGSDLKALIDKAVRARMAVAYERGRSNGFAEGVSDALDDEPIPRKPNPYE